MNKYCPLLFHMKTIRELNFRGYNPEEKSPNLTRNFNMKYLNESWILHSCSFLLTRHCVRSKSNVNVMKTTKYFFLVVLNADSTERNVEFVRLPVVVAAAIKRQRKRSRTNILCEATQMTSCSKCFLRVIAIIANKCVSSNSNLPISYTRLRQANLCLIFLEWQINLF